MLDIHFNVHFCMDSGWYKSSSYHMSWDHYHRVNMTLGLSHSLGESKSYAQNISYLSLPLNIYWQSGKMQQFLSNSFSVVIKMGTKITYGEAWMIVKFLILQSPALVILYIARLWQRMDTEPATGVSRDTLGSTDRLNLVLIFNKFNYVPLLFLSFHSYKHMIRWTHNDHKISNLHAWRSFRLSLTGQ